MENNKSIYSIEDFAEEVSKAIHRSFDNVTTEVNRFDKFNESYLAVSVRKDGSALGVNINIEPAYYAYKSGLSSFEDICDHVKSVLEDGFTHEPKIDLDAFKDYSQMRNNLFMEVVSVEANKELLDTVPHKLLEDMAIIYRLDLKDQSSNLSYASTVITNKLLDEYGITKEELHRDAVKFAPLNRPMEIMGMLEALIRKMDPKQAEMLGLTMPPEVEPFLIASVEGDTHGASVIAYEEFMSKAAERIGGSFYILPSSIHEVILIPDCGIFDLTTLKEMVSSTNATTIDPKDKLTDSVYHYDADKKIFELGEKYLNRLAGENN